MPIWREIHQTLRREISAAKYATGDKLPTEKQLSERFAVNRHTVRRALAELTTEGVIAVRRGSGAYVAEGIVDYRLGPKVRFSQNIGDLGRAHAHRLLRADVIPADDATLRALDLATGAMVVALETLGEVDGLPVAYSTHVYPASRFAGLGESFAETGSITKALARHGVSDYRRKWTRITARAPSRMVAAKLRQAENQATLRVESLSVDLDGAPIEFSRADWAGARVQFLVQQP